MSLKKILSLSLGLVILAALAILISTGTVGAQSLRLNPLVAAPPPPSVPVSVVNTPLPVTGSVGINGTVPVSVNVSATISNPAIAVNNTAAAPLNTEEVNKTTAHLVHDGQSFSLQPNPNIAFEFDPPPSVILTDVQLTLTQPSLAVTVFVADTSNKTFIAETVGTPRTNSGGTSDGHFEVHLQSGLYSPLGLRIGLICSNIGGNSCSGALMWSGYQP